MLLPLLVALVACKNDGVRPTTVVTVADSADQVLQGFRHFVTRDGVRDGEIEADTAFFYDDTQSTQLRRMRMVFFDSAGGERATIVAQRGQYLWQKGSMVAEGGVILTTADGKTLKSEKLVYDAEKKELSTDVPFVFDDNATHVEGDGFRSDLQFANIRAARPKGRAREGVLLPGQEEPDDSSATP